MVSPVFFLGTGRCGTHFAARLLSRHNSVQAYHLDDSDAPSVDAFYSYAAWHGLGVDCRPLIENRTKKIAEAQYNGRVYVEANPYLSSLVNTVMSDLGGRVVLLLRNPEKVVVSHQKKGWFSDPYNIKNRTGPTPPQYDLPLQYGVGRLTPTANDEYERWNSLSQVGKISWYVNALNRYVYESLSELSPSIAKVIRIEDLSYKKYEELAYWVGLKASISEAQYLKVRDSRAGKLSLFKRRKTIKWEKQEKAEFGAEVGWLLDNFYPEMK